MSLFKKKPDTAPAVDTNAETDLDEVMRKYDRESNTRIWTGWRKIVIKVLMALFALYCIGMTLFSTAMPESAATPESAAMASFGMSLSISASSRRMVSISSSSSVYSSSVNFSFDVSSCAVR